MLPLLSIVKELTGITVPSSKAMTLAFALARRPSLYHLDTVLTPPLAPLRLVVLDGLTDATNVGTIVKLANWKPNCGKGFWRSCDADARQFSQPQCSGSHGVPEDVTMGKLEFVLPWFCFFHLVTPILELFWLHESYWSIPDFMTVQGFHTTSQPLGQKTSPEESGHSLWRFRIASFCWLLRCALSPCDSGTSVPTWILSGCPVWKLNHRSTPRKADLGWI